MLKKIGNKVMKINLKKGFIGLAIAGLIFVVGSGVLMYQNFGDRITQTRNELEQQREELVQEYETEKDTSLEQFPERYSHGYGRESQLTRNWSVNDYHSGMKAEWNLAMGDRVLIGVIMGIGALIGILYWFLCVVWAYQKANKLGSNLALWVIATLFFNFWAIVALYIYAGFKGKCKNCGHMKNKGEKYCSECGNEFEKVCKECQASVAADAKYCWNCGKSMEKEDSLK